MHFKHLSLALLTIASAYAASTNPMDYTAARNICGNGQHQSFCNKLEKMYQEAKTAGIKTKEELHAIQQSDNGLESRYETTGSVMNVIINNLNSITSRPDLDPEIRSIIQQHPQDLLAVLDAHHFSIFLSYACNTEIERFLMVSAYMQYTYLIALQQLQNL